MNKLKSMQITEKKVKIFFVILVFLLTLIISTNIKYGNAPDEEMKYVVCKYIYENNSLPIGSDPAIINTLWGTSYGFTPVLSYIFSGIFMKIISIFTTDKMALCIAARFTSVLCYTGLAIITIKIADKIFEEKKIYKWLFIVMITCLPQLMFLGSYINNDSLAMFSIALIIYAWICGIKSKWKWKDVITLGIGIGICALSYYNAYGYILTSVILFIISFFINNKEKIKVNIYNLLKKGLVISAIALVIAGWWFVRNYIIYDGDFLGREASDKCAEINASPEYKPSIHETPQKIGESVWQVLIERNWLSQTIKSFIGMFGFNAIAIPNILYKLYCLIYLVGFIGAIIYVITNLKKKYYNKEKNKLLLEIIFIINILISLYLSFIYSYTSDFQPQGRYIMPILIPFMYFTTIGLKQVLESILNIGIIKEKIEKKIKIQKLEKILIVTLTIVLFIIPFIFLPRAWK